MKKRGTYFAIAVLIALGIIILIQWEGKPTGFVVFNEYLNETIEQCDCLEYEIINETTNETGDCINWTSCINETCSEQENCTEIITGGYCTGICDSSHLELCNETNCESDGGGYWYDDTCNAEEEPSCSNDLTLCLDENSCEDEGGYWYNETCNAEEEPSCSNDLNLCNETNCENVGGGYWYNEVCNKDECESDEQCESDEECDSGECVEIQEDTEDTSEEETTTEETSISELFLIFQK